MSYIVHSSMLISCCSMLNDVGWEWLHGKKMVKTSSLMDDRIIKYEDVDIDAHGRLDHPAGSLVFGQ